MSTTRSPRVPRTEKSVRSSTQKPATAPNRTKPSSHVPKFRSRQAEAEFWDTHSFADYWDEFTPAKVRFAKKLSAPVSMRLDLTTLEAVRERAAAIGIGPTTLIRIWIMERLQAEQRAARRKRTRAG